MKTVEDDREGTLRRKVLSSVDDKPTGHERSGRAPVSDRSSPSLRVAHSRFHDRPASSSHTTKDGKGRGVQLLCLPSAMWRRFPHLLTVGPEVSTSDSGHSRRRLLPTLQLLLPLTDELSAMKTIIPPYASIAHLHRSSGLQSPC